MPAEPFKQRSLMPRFGAIALLLGSLAACGLWGGAGGTHSADGGPPTLEAGDDTSSADGHAGSDSASDVEAEADRGDPQADAGYASPAAVKLATADNFVVLAQSGISTVPASTIIGDLGVSPATASAITGFSLIADPTNKFSTSTQVTGKVYAADHKSPTPATLTLAIADMQTAFSDAASRAADVTELGAGDISGKTIKRGVYKWSTGLLISTDVTLQGNGTDVWIFEIAQNLTMANAAKIVLVGGALPKNVFWQFSGAVTLGTSAHIEGIILAQTSIALQTGASIKGRLLAQSAVTIDACTLSAW